jgi:hypothetical protein
MSKRESEGLTGEGAKKARKQDYKNDEELPEKDKAKPIADPEIDDGLKKYLDKMFGDLNDKIDDIKKDVTFLQKDVKLLVSVSPVVAIQMIDPMIVESMESNKMAVLKGGESTWSYLLSDQQDDDRLWAVGSVHCGLFYKSKHPTLSFVNLPQEVIDLGVAEIGFLNPKEIDNPISYKFDIMIVKLQKTKKFPENRSPHKYSVFAADAYQHIQRVAGKSNSGIVSGTNVVTHEDGHLVFVEDFGESGNSGTLMFGWGSDAHEAKPVGVYFGVKDKDSTLRPRGIVAPLPDPKNITWFSVEQKQFPADLVVVDGKNPSGKHCNIIRDAQSCGPACFLEDDGKWPGVLLKFKKAKYKIKYCGSLECGSRRCV